MQNAIQIEWPEWDRIINKKFIPLTEDKSRYMVLYGGRASSKSDFAAKLLIHRCIFDNYFRCIGVRKTLKSVKDSLYTNIKEKIEDFGLDHLFEFKVQPPEIIFKPNGNKFIFRGFENIKQIKSIENPTCVIYEEDIPDEADFITITNTIRTSKADILQEIFCIQPEVTGDHNDHWFFKFFFADNIGQKSFSTKKYVEVDGKIEQISITAHHSTYNDNAFVDKKNLAYLESLKQSNPYRYLIDCLGEWGTPDVNGLFYYNFSRTDNVSTSIGYNPEKSLHISFDQNRFPYYSCSIWQLEGKTAYCIDEIAAKTPNNSAEGICRLFKQKYHSHTAGLFVYGDPSGRKTDTIKSEGINHYKLILTELDRYHPQMRVAIVAPNVEMRGMYINEIFKNGFNGVSIQISDKCNYMITDLMNVKQAADGTKLKQRENKDGVTQEKYGHLSDTLDYLICEAFKSEYMEHKDGGIKLEPIFGKREINPRSSY